ncbi:MAG: methyl-accepting chemotaxis protein [bacterium]|nr:methyl-accepting chemotaxis protein [bacterium]
MKRFKSLQVKIAFWTGICLFVSAAAIITYSASIMRERANVTREQAIKDTERYVVSVAKQYANYIQGELDVALDAARTLSQTLAGIKDAQVGLDLERDEVIGILKTILAQNPQFLGVYTAWEPDAFDEMDVGYADGEGHDSTGRFIPYWSRNDEGNITLEHLIDYTVSDYYLLPKETKNECIIDPSISPIHGKSTMITSLVAPIMVGETFYGIAGVDLRLERFQNMVDDVTELYDGAARILLISYNGTLVAATHETELMGKHLKTVHEDDFAEDVVKIQNSQEFSKLEEKELEVFTPLHVGRVNTPWAVNIIVPKEKITELADAQRKQAEQAMMRMIGISIFFTLAALAVLWIVTRTISRPLIKAVDFVRNVSEGDLNTILTLNRKESAKAAKSGTQINRWDEIGNLLNNMTVMVNVLKERSRNVKQIADGDLSVEMKILSEKDELGQSLSLMVQKLREIIGEIRTVAVELLKSVQNINVSSQEISTTSTQQAASVKEIVSTMEDSDQLAKSIATKINDVTDNTNTTKSVVNDGFSMIKSSLTKMGEIKVSNAETITEIKSLGEKIASIWDIVNMINGIADQTKIIAFNAELEASSAGDAGKNFQIVASEIRRLADSTVSSTSEIKIKINEIQHSSDHLIMASEEGTQKITEGWELSNNLQQVFEDILTSSETSASATDQIALSINQQVSAFEQILLTLRQISTGIDNFVVSTSSTSESSGKLREMASSLHAIIEQFVSTDEE